jgi:hypothetical protein
MEHFHRVSDGTDARRGSRHSQHSEHLTTVVKVVRGVSLRASDADVDRESLSEARQTMPEGNRHRPIGNLHILLWGMGEPQPGLRGLTAARRARVERPRRTLTIKIIVERRLICP